MKTHSVTFRSEPWSIVLEKVYIVVGPQAFKDYDPYKEEQLALEVGFLRITTGSKMTCHDSTKTLICLILRRKMDSLK